MIFQMYYFNKLMEIMLSYLQMILLLYVNAKIHYQYETVREFLDMIDRYSELEAEQRVKKGQKFSYLKLFIGPIYNFLVRYFYRLGFLDGWRGFVLSYLMAIYHLTLWVKIWERSK